MAQRDSLLLESVEVAGMYAAGAKTTQIDSAARAIHQGQSIGELLQASSSLYLRTYGAEGQLTSVSFRGTTPNQTQVSWKGIDINSQTLGQSDFSSIPSFLFNTVSLHHGASSTLFGSGAVGGVVDLTNKMQSGLFAQLNQQIGSFGKVFTGVKGQFSTSGWGVQIAGVHNRVENNFEVDYRGDSYEQNNAASSLNAITGEAFMKFGSSKLTASLWLNEHDREAQPIIGFLNAQDHLLDRNFRSNLSFEAALSPGYLNFSLAYVDDRQTYNHGSVTNLKRLVFNGEFEFEPIRNWRSRVGTNFTHGSPAVSAYESVASQIRWDAFLLNQWKTTERLNITANLRLPYQEFQDKIPLVPSLGAEYLFIEGSSRDLSGAVKAARSFRFPTFNNLYWSPGGNKDLLPEDGYTVESSWNLEERSSYVKLNAALSAYMTRISEMIVWVPSGSFWSPQNVQTVRVSGVEAELSIAKSYKQWSWRIHGTYAYNHSEYAELSTQLPYVPFHKASVVTDLKWLNWNLTYLESFTGKRYTENTNTVELPAFLLAQLSLGHDIHLDDHVVNMTFQVKNLWDETYQNYELRATPGRHYLVQINYQLSKSL